MNRYGAASGRELEGVADQVGQQLNDPLAIETQDDRRRRDATLSRPMPRASATSDSAWTTAWIGSRRSPSRMSSGKIPASIRDRSSRLVLSHSSRPICSVERSRNSARVDLVDLAVSLELGVHAQRGDRRPQLVAHVGDELAQAVAISLQHAERFREPIGHHVELGRQLVDLQHPRRGRPLVEVALGNATGQVPKAVDRCGHPAGCDDAEDDG